MTAGGWRPTRAAARTALVTGAALLAAVLAGRPALVLLAAPFAWGAALALSRRPGPPPPVDLILGSETTDEDGPVDARVRVRRRGGSALVCVVGVRTADWVRLRHGAGRYAALVAPDSDGVVRVTGTALRWGRHQLGPVTVVVTAADGLLSTAVELPGRPVLVLPTGGLFDADEPLPRAAGVAGIHRSRRPGTDGELSGVRPFQPGDRLRRINWRVTSRSRDLHVNATLSERDADVVLLLDVRYEAGRSGGVDGPASVLDTTVRAAAAITGHHVRQGDRVALVELGTRLRRLPAGSGRRHHRSALEWLADIDRYPNGLLPGVHLVTAGLRPPGALLVTLTPLLDLDSAALLIRAARSGRPVVAVDTLPEGVRPPVWDRSSRVAGRLWWLERATILDQLRDLGVPVTGWRGPGSLDAVLRHTYRVAQRVRV